MNILVTGSKGFIGKHICFKLNLLKQNVFEFDIDNSDEQLIEFVKKCDFIIHLAGINRPLNKEEFYNGNTNFTYKLVELINQYNQEVPIIMSSSIQATLDNDYGKSKLYAENYILDHVNNAYIYRLYNVYGKWCKPNYNSVVATFCYNIANNLDIKINNPNTIVTYNYIDDIVEEFIDIILKNKIVKNKQINYVDIKYDCSLFHLSELLYYFKKEIQSDNHLPIINNEFEYKLFKTFCSYLTEDNNLNYAFDERGSFEELYKSNKYGQISENIAFPNIVKGMHYHKYKKEIFYPIIGKSKIVQQSLDHQDTIIDIIDNDNRRMVEMKTNYLHSIENIDNKKTYTLMWISEIYNEKSPDTYKGEMKKINDNGDKNE
ncbi:MAG: NAD-dependent epimerase/dehydratase family protein [Bacillales bacterium]|nr:NAD-dependent epimerase/dehydratase family protein [Bacillales bacterium]